MLWMNALIMEYIYPHPNKNKPFTYKLQIREIQCQKYFGFEEYGSKEKAMKAAIKERDRLLQARALQKALPIHQFFDKNGLIKGLRFFIKDKSVDPKINLSITQNSLGIKQHKRVTEDNFDTVFIQFTSMLMDRLELDLDPADQKRLVKIRMKYVREFQRLLKNPDKPGFTNIKDATKPRDLINEHGGVTYLQSRFEKHKYAEPRFLLLLKFPGTSERYFPVEHDKDFKHTLDRALKAAFEYHEVDKSTLPSHLLTKIKKYYKARYYEIEKLRQVGKSKKVQRSHHINKVIQDSGRIKGLRLSCRQYKSSDTEAYYLFTVTASGKKEGEKITRKDFKTVFDGILKKALKNQNIKMSDIGEKEINRSRRFYKSMIAV